ncbi:hypothetical protein COOONC_28004 [Cooperia oncophora]
MVKSVPSLTNRTQTFAERVAIFQNGRNFAHTTTARGHWNQESQTYHKDFTISFRPTKSDRCSAKRKIGNFNQIEHYDGGTLLVPHLQVAVKDYLNNEDFICISPKGERVSTEPPYQGTSAFCEKHQCSDKANKFCIYDVPITLFDFSSSTSSTLLIPIKAWGTTTTEFYPHNLQTYAESILILTNCSKGGLEIKADQEIDIIEACIASYCIFASHVSTTSLLFPTELVVFKYTIQVTAWQNGLSVHQSSLTCPAHPICEILHCSFCLEKLYNTQCWTNFDILLATTSFVIAISLYWILNHYVPSSDDWSDSLGLWSDKRHIRREECFSTPFRPYNRASRRSRSMKKATLIVTILALALKEKLGHCCSDIVSITSATESLSIVNSTETCFFNQGVTVTLQPLGQDICLALRNDKNEPSGQVSLRMKHLSHVCHQKIEFFTRDHEFQSESSHRCYRAGSCKPGKCDNTKSTDVIPEFSWKASNNPGFTFCTSSCQCWNCDGCFFCKPSCLFYRYYATPSSDTIYTVFTCPVCELTVTADVTLHLQNQETETHSVVLRPGRTARVKNIFAWICQSYQNKIRAHISARADWI